MRYASERPEQAAENLRSGLKAARFWRGRETTQKSMKRPWRARSIQNGHRVALRRLLAHSTRWFLSRFADRSISAVRGSRSNRDLRISQRFARRAVETLSVPNGGHE